MLKIITICGSMKFFNEIKELKMNLEKLGFEVLIPSEEGTEIDYTKLTKRDQSDLKQNFIDQHIDKIKKSDYILLANYPKNNIKDYIGANTFLEMGFAYILRKPIFILNDIPEQSNTVEIKGLKPIVLNGDLNYLTKL